MGAPLSCGCCTGGSKTLAFLRCTALWIVQYSRERRTVPVYSTMKTMNNDMKTKQSPVVNAAVSIGDWIGPTRDKPPLWDKIHERAYVERRVHVLG